MALQLSEEAKKYQDANEITDDASAKALREKNYKSYFNTQLQLAATRELGNKYYQESLQRQGMGSSGEGTTGNVLMNNAFMNAQANNLGNYQQQEAQITADNATRYQNELASRDANFISQLNTIGQMEADFEQKNKLIDELVANYGYGNDASSAVQSSIALARAQANNGTPSGVSASWFNSQNAIADTDTLKESLKYYNKPLETMVSDVNVNGAATDNSVYALNNGTTTVYIYYYKGNYYRISKDDALKMKQGGSKAYSIDKSGEMSDNAEKFF